MVSTTSGTDVDVRHGHRHRLDAAALVVAVTFAALVVAVVITLNLHIFLGVEGGYTAGPAAVLERSAWLVAVDAAVLVGLPVLANALVLGRRRGRP